MKKWYDKDVKNRTFNPGDKGLALFLIPGHSLQVFCEEMLVLTVLKNISPVSVVTRLRIQGVQECSIPKNAKL